MTKADAIRAILAYARNCWWHDCDTSEVDEPTIHNTAICAEYPACPKEGSFLVIYDTYCDAGPAAGQYDKVQVAADYVVRCRRHEEIVWSSDECIRSYDGFQVVARAIEVFGDLDKDYTFLHELADESELATPAPSGRGVQWDVFNTGEGEEIQRVDFPEEQGHAAESLASDYEACIEALKHWMTVEDPKESQQLLRATATTLLTTWHDRSRVGAAIDLLTGRGDACEALETLGFDSSKLVEQHPCGEPVDDPWAWNPWA